MIPRVLVLCDSRPHSHCYGVDFFIQALYSVLGGENVIEYPEKPNLHLSVGEERDWCQIDSDAWLPSKRAAPASSIASVDLVIITTPWGPIIDDIRAVGQQLPARIPVLGLQYDDEQNSGRARIEAALGRSLVAYFVRENPQAGEQPIWLSQPVARVRLVAHKPRWASRVFYAATTHEWSVDNPRSRMLQAITDVTAPEERWFLTTARQDQDRISPERYRDMLWESGISVNWNSNLAVNFLAWDSNRLWESLALGCAMICERPRYRSPAPYLDSVLWIDQPEDAARCCRFLLDHPDERRARAAAAQAAFLSGHTSEMRVRTVLSAAGVTL